MNIKNLSIEDLNSLLSLSKDDILKEIESREKRKFPFDVSDCFLSDNRIYKITEIDNGVIFYDYISIYENYIGKHNDYIHIANHHFDRMKKINITIYEIIEGYLDSMSSKIEDVKKRFSSMCVDTIKANISDYEDFNTFFK
ncbi:MAG: hypothetical protein IKT40_12325 [Bacilli bacterium]|nr:hypothetical protein [Bacilli bacterium]